MDAKEPLAEAFNAKTGDVVLLVKVGVTYAVIYTSTSGLSRIVPCGKDLKGAAVEWSKGRCNILKDIPKDLQSYQTRIPSAHYYDLISESLRDEIKRLSLEDAQLKEALSRALGREIK